tara:strand:- start:77 stop:727 length:651 start_codon:yes stop_codon:yes gene_type:complete
MIESNLKKRIQTSIILLLLVYFMIVNNLISTYVLIVFGVLSVIEFLQISRKIFSKILLRYFINFFFILYISLFCYLFLLFTNLPYLKIIIYTVLFGCIASDVGGFVFGKILKGPKITKISPNKTYSGAFGSIIFTCLIVSLSLFFFTNNFSFIVIILSIIISSSCQIGDLFFSFLKRKAKIKDTGRFFPGHGGILDRMDGILLGIPLGLISIIILH